MIQHKSEQFIWYSAGPVLVEMLSDVLCLDYGSVGLYKRGSSKHPSARWRTGDVIYPLSCKTHIILNKLC